MKKPFLKSIGLIKNRISEKAPFNVQGQKSKSWLHRSEVAVSFLHSIRWKGGNQKTRIADFGCGDKKIEDCLRKANIDFEYTGYDINPQSKFVRVINLNEELPDQSFDVIFCLGVLEYIHNLDWFFSKLAKITDNAIISYTVADSGKYTKDDLQKYGWGHHYNIDDLEHIFTGNGFKKQRLLLLDRERIALWLLTREEREVQ